MYLMGERRRKPLTFVQQLALALSVETVLFAWIHGLSWDTNSNIIIALAFASFAFVYLPRISKRDAELTLKNNIEHSANPWDAQRTSAQQAAHEMLRDLIGHDYSDTTHRIATDHMLSFQRMQRRTEHPTPS